jgi:hypothetical protein
MKSDENDFSQMARNRIRLRFSARLKEISRHSYSIVAARPNVFTQPRPKADTQQTKVPALFVCARGAATACPAHWGTNTSIASSFM